MFFIPYTFLQIEKKLKQKSRTIDHFSKEMLVTKRITQPEVNCYTLSCAEYNIPHPNWIAGAGERESEEDMAAQQIW